MNHLIYLEKLLDGSKVEWKALEEVAFFANGKGHEKVITENGNYIVVNSKFISTDGKVAKYSDEELCPLSTDDILIVMSDLPNGKALAKTFIVDNDNKYTLNQRIGAISVKNKKLLLPKFLNYFLNRTPSLTKYDNGVDQTNLKKGQILDVQIPIPCPDNPEKSLAIQAEIVRILDGFKTLFAELTTELYMRKNQYSHYQFELLKFTETTQQLNIGECCDIKKGATPIKKATPGKYPLVATTEERQSSSEYQFDCPAVCVPLISSRGHGVASIDRIYYQDGKFALGNILCAITPNDSELLSAKFLRYYLFDKKDVLLVPLMRGGANVSLTMDSLKKVKIPIPPIADQQRIVRALDKFDEFVKALPCEIGLRQKQYEYYRDLLLTFPQSNSDEAA